MKSKSKESTNFSLPAGYIADEEKRDELKNVKESMSELESALESVSESVEDFVEHFVESEHDYLVREHARLREEVNMLRDNPEMVLSRLPEELWIKVHSQTLNGFLIGVKSV